jgi:hypothetical protein
LPLTIWRYGFVSLPNRFNPTINIQGLINYTACYALARADKTLIIMMIPHGFDEANTDRKKRINRNTLSTAEKLNRRMIQFMEDVGKNSSLTEGQKKKIRERLLEHL